MVSNDYRQINRQSWNNQVDIHLQSAFYKQQAFLEGNSSLQSIETGILGDVSGQSLLHLQCHFGQDTLSLARMGAMVTGVDISDKGIDTARSLADQLNLPARFICCDLYELPQHLEGQFDIIFTSYGVIGWLPNLDRWANLISHFLKPGGRLVFVEFHPVIWMYDDDFEKVAYDYFNTGPIAETQTGTYADPAAPLTSGYISWNHDLGEVLSSLLGNGLQLTLFREYDYSPYSCFKDTIEIEPGKFHLRRFDKKIPMVYALEAVKPV